MNEIIWKRSSSCGGGGNNCVEIAELPDGIGIRDSVYPDRVVRVGRPTLSTFLSSVEPEAIGVGLR
ncbi:DUF397 domain-containing protein [Streptomyces vinaceus]|uniref:DUF397 domain-containing protein n=1 Tax=Streptomyces vinaceus TaxID=1960 RepID=UPI0035E112C3